MSSWTEWMRKSEKEKDEIIRSGKCAKDCADWRGRKYWDEENNECIADFCLKGQCIKDHNEELEMKKEQERIEKEEYRRTHCSSCGAALELLCPVCHRRHESDDKLPWMYM